MKPTPIPPIRWTDVWNRQLPGAAAVGRYSETVMDHFEDPRNCGRMEDATAIGRVHPHHGPRMTIYILVENKRVSRASFEAHGCGFSIAACSVLTELVENKPIVDCAKLTPSNLDEALGGLPMDKQFSSALAIEALQAALAQLNPEEFTT